MTNLPMQAMKSLFINCPVSGNSIANISFRSASAALLALAAALLLVAKPVQAGNLLVNPGFESQPSGQRCSDWLDVFCAADA